MLLYLVKKLQTFAATTLNIDIPQVYAASKNFYRWTSLTAVEKYSIKTLLGQLRQVLHAGSDVRVEVNIVGSQDTGDDLAGMESMAATVISPIVDGAYQSGCHTASVWDNKKQIFLD
jgi:aconitate hydratase 2/2-methylisocitrate dehydratase